VYADGHGILRKVIAEITSRGFLIAEVATQQLEHKIGDATVVAVTLELRGRPTAERLAIALSDLDGVFSVATSDHSRNGE
jgi:putative Mg2+ transporter-C (MgtC) family protein